MLAITKEQFNFLNGQTINGVFVVIINNCIIPFTKYRDHYKLESRRSFLKDFYNNSSDDFIDDRFFRNQDLIVKYL